MARKCYVATCTNTYKKTKNLCVIDEKSCTITAITYHSFPKHPQLRQKWIEATGRNNWEPTNGSFICSEHFKESDYETIRKRPPENGENPTQLKRVLKKDAFPTVQIAKGFKLEEFSVYSKENNADLSDNESELSSDENTFFIENTLDLNIVKKEPYSPDEVNVEQPNPPFLITSAVTVKEENDDGIRHNGFLESPPDYSGRNHLDSRYEYSSDHIRPKRQKHQDSLIAPEDIKIERCPSPFDFNTNLSIEEKYERLLDEFLKLRRDYDLLKFKYDRQRDAINKCEHILSECR